MHALRGKEHVEWDNPYDVGMTGLIGFSSGYYAMLDCDVLLMLGTDFPYRQFYPHGTGARIAQVDIRAGADRPPRAGRSRRRRRRRRDARRAVAAAARRSAIAGISSRRCSTIARRARASTSSRSATPGKRAIHPQQVAKAISDHAAEDAVFTCDVGLPTVWAARYLAMNGKRRLIGSFWHGSMANAMAQAIGAQAAFPGRQVISLSGDGGFTMLMGDLLSLDAARTAGEGRRVQQRRARLRRARAEVDRLSRLRHRAATIRTLPPWPKPSAYAASGSRMPADVEEGIAAALAHDGPVLVDAVVSRTELAMPPAITAEMAKGLHALHGEGDLQRPRRRTRRPRSSQPLAHERRGPAMDATALLLSRLQFAFTISFHIIYPSFTIGLAAWLTVLDALYLATGRPAYRVVFEFWLKIFGVAFGLGVVSGIVMAFQFGANWSVLSRMSGPIQGPLLSYETFTAFMLEASFFGVLVFGRPRVTPWFYLFSTAMVALGTTFSAFWIMVNNSWMQAPTGYVMENGAFAPSDWTTIIFNPVVWVRFPHMLLAAYLTGAFCVAATGAWYLLRRQYTAEARIMLRMGLFLAAVLVPIQLFFGHLTGDYVHDYQPAKFAAIEARWHDEQPAGEVVIALPDAAAETNHYEIKVPVLGSLIGSMSFTSKEVRLGRFSAAGSAAGAHPVLRFPHHDRLWVGDAGARLDRLLSERHAADWRAIAFFCG